MKSASLITTYLSILLVTFRLFILCFCLGIATISTAKNSGLDLANISTIDVLLFELDPPSDLTISAIDGNVEIKSAQNLVQKDGDPAFRIRIQNNRISVQHPSGTFQTQELTLYADDSALNRMYHPRLGIRYYRGNIRISVNPDGRTFRIINTVDLEDYIGSVVGGEMNFPEMEALKVQAVIARTYALWSLALSRHTDYQLTDHTMSQVYNGMLISRPDYLQAALATSGQILTWSDKLILAAYSSTCGGTTSDNESIWSGGPLPYLRSVSDGDACSASPHYRWQNEVSKSEIYSVLRQHTGRHVTGITINETDARNLVTSLLLHISGGDSIEIQANAFRLLVNRQVKQGSILSTRFELIDNENSYIFTGKGLGHGIGLCQWGARGLAQAGWNYRDILKFYYSGTEIVDFHTIDTETLELAR